MFRLVGALTVRPLEVRLNVGEALHDRTRRLWEGEPTGDGQDAREPPWKECER